MRAFTTLPAAPDHWAEDMRRMCAAAAALSMRGENYSPEDRAECAAAILSQHLTAAHSAPRCDCGGPADRRTVGMDDYGNAVYLRAVCPRHRGADWRTLTGRSDALPSFSTLLGTASNYRRSLSRQRARDQRDAAETAARDAFMPALPDDAPEVRSTPWGARRTALDMLRTLGLDERAACRKGGPLWTAAYAAARAAAGLDSETVAAELDLSPATYRQHLSRAAGRIPSAAALPVSAHAAALGMEDTTPGHKAAWTRMHSADLDTPTLRDHLPAAQHAPVTCRDIRTVLDMAGTAPEMPAPDWTRDLPAATRARLNAAAGIRRARAAAKPAAQRATDRMAAGLPATVR
jgi:hypothetical protein